MNTITIEFPYINEQGFSTAIHPFSRPDIVVSHSDPLPSWIGSPLERPFTFTQECCCEGFGGFSGYAPVNLPAVPEASTWMMIVIGMCIIAAVKKWRNV